MANRDVRLVLWSDANFSGRRIVFRRGGVAIRDLRAFQYNDVLSSFRLTNLVQRSQVTLVLFRDINFQGPFRVFRGSQSVASLTNFNFNDQTSSLILVGRRLTNFQINRIRNTGVAPRDILIIRQ